MGLFSKAIKAGIAKKAIDEARKPHNQRKIKELISSLSSRKSAGGRGSHRY